MKRSGPPRRKAPLAQGKGLDRGTTPLKRSAGLTRAAGGLSRATELADTIGSCASCGTQFVRRTTHLGVTKYCSRECFAAAQVKERQPQSCSYCGKEFVPEYPSSGTRCCSDACSRKAKAAAKRAANPMKQPEVAVRNARRAELDGPLALPRTGTCARPGCGHPVPERASFYCSPRCQYDDAARRKTLAEHRARDFNDPSPTCRVCGAAGVQNHHVIYAQHIKRVDPARTWDPDVALTLCLKCHGDAHSHRRIPVSALRDVNFEFAYGLLGEAAHDYLARRYSGDDARLQGILG